MRMLVAFDLPVARSALLGLQPELRKVVSLMATIAWLQNEGGLDAASVDLARQVAVACRNYVGYLQETRRSTLDIAQQLALLRVKQACRDIAQAVSWPFGGPGGTHRLTVTQAGVLALSRLRLYDPVQGPSSYASDMARDVRQLAGGVGALRVKP